MQSQQKMLPWLLGFAMMVPFYQMAKQGLPEFLNSQKAKTFRSIASESEQNPRWHEFNAKLLNLEMKENVNSYQFLNEMHLLLNDYQDVLTGPVPDGMLRSGVDANGTPLGTPKDMKMAEYLIENRIAFLSFANRAKGDAKELETNKGIALLNELKNRYPAEFERAQYGYVSGFEYGDCGTREPGQCRPKLLIDHLKNKLKKESSESIREEMLDLMPVLELNSNSNSRPYNAKPEVKKACQQSPKKILKAIEDKLMEQPQTRYFTYTGRGAIERNLHLFDLQKLQMSVEYQGDQVSSITIRCEDTQGSVKVDLLETPKAKSEFVAWINMRRQSMKKSASIETQRPPESLSKASPESTGGR